MKNKKEKKYKDSSKKKVSNFNKKRLALLIGLFVAIVVVVLIIINISKPNNNDKVIDKIDEANGYVLRKTNTDYFKTLFNNYKTEIMKDPRNEEAEALLISQMFLADLFDLDSKSSSNDIGGTQFVFEGYKDDFIKLSGDKIYKGIQNIEERGQVLPKIHSVTVATVNRVLFDYPGGSDSEAYEIKLTIGYVEDIGYGEEFTIVVIHSNNKLEIASLQIK